MDNSNRSDRNPLHDSRFYPKKIFAQIAGFPGSGKTTLLKKLKETFKFRFVYKDVDDFLEEFDDSNPVTSNKMYQKIQEFVGICLQPVILVGTFGLEPYEMHSHYPIFRATYHIWLDVSLKESMRRALKRQIEASYKNFDSFYEIQEEKSSREITDWLNEYYNMKFRGERWESLKDIYVNDMFFSPLSESEILYLFDLKTRSARNNQTERDGHTDTNTQTHTLLRTQTTSYTFLNYLDEPSSPGEVEPVQHSRITHLETRNFSGSNLDNIGLVYDRYRESVRS
jgi:uridine kinase